MSGCMAVHILQWFRQNMEAYLLGWSTSDCPAWAVSNSQSCLTFWNLPEQIASPSGQPSPQVPLRLSSLSLSFLSKYLGRPKG